MNSPDPGLPIVRQRNFAPGRIAFAASPTVLAAEARARLLARYGDCAIEHATVVVALGGDGFMLETLHRVLARDIPVYGMNCGSVGFLMNTFSEDDLPGRLARAQETTLYPMRMHAVTAAGAIEQALAFNEVSLLRQLRQTSKIRVTVDGRVRLAELMCDGILITTPAGSTAYNLSAHGPIVPLSANLFPLTPISRVPPAALAGRAAAEHRRGAVRGAGSRTSVRSPRSPISPRCATWSRWRCARTARSASTVLFDPDQRPVGAHHRRAVHGVAAQLLPAV